ncbi:hypothetical protein CRE_26313 [Caenorhabditis remanei]|uniref:G-protein coupled receptors family 1 profile domain-containing protein n=1 Tax=Caenorhabditis remanei TaxID=31234 RepID=E3LRA7_CAERE|nr:hypothetical protein CRE_26313 [Caenorhabditis remanei]
MDVLVNITDLTPTPTTSATPDECGLEPHDFLEVKFFLISVVGTLIGLFGLFGNATTALILTRPSMRNPNNLFLTALAVFDSCLLITAFFIYAMEYIIEYTAAFDLYVAWLTYLRFAFALSHISQTGSVYITVAVTIERYLAVTVNPSCPDGSNWQSYILLPSAMASNPIYQQVYSLWVTNFVMVFFPFLTLLLFNAIIAYTIRQSLEKYDFHNQKSVVAALSASVNLPRNIAGYCPSDCLCHVPLSSFTLRGLAPRRTVVIDSSTGSVSSVATSLTSPESFRISSRNELKEKSREATLVLVIIVFIFLGCNFWGFVLTLLERIMGQETLMVDHHIFYTFSREAINFLAIINSSINFVIYLLFGKDFRKELVVVYGCGIRGISLRLPVQDKFVIWRHWKRTKSRLSTSATNRTRHKISLPQTLVEHANLERLEQTRFLAHHEDGLQTQVSPIHALRNGSIPKFDPLRDSNSIGRPCKTSIIDDNGTVVCTVTEFP